MRSEECRCFRPRARLRARFGRLIASIATAFGLASLAWLSLTDDARALPSYARQTGQPCGTCHTDFPGLTPFGRRFKLLGYTTGGGLYRTTPFSPSRDANDANAALRAYAAEQRIDGNAPLAPVGSGEKGWVPPVSAMTVIGLTHAQTSATGNTAPYGANDIVTATPTSFFYGGAITNNIGAFAQVTWNAPPAGGFSDPFGHTWTWDNTDIRFASTAHVGSLDFIYGITANNNPTVQDVWNTTPAWQFPYAAPFSLGNTNATNGPPTNPLIQGAFAARVGSVGAYTMINDFLYLEATVYRTLNFSQQNTMGSDPVGSPGLFDYAPYWRVALEPHWGSHTFMLGAFGMYFNIHPWIDTSGLTSQGTIAQTNKFNDVGFDSQYQYQGNNWWLTLRGTYIHEFQTRDADFGGFTATAPTNLNNTIDSLKLYGSVALGGDHRVVLSSQYFNIRGSADLGLYGADPNTGAALSPASDGFNAEIAYIPFGVSRAPGWPWFNARIGLQYTYFNRFNGTTAGAQNHNTLFLHAWLAM